MLNHEFDLDKRHVKLSKMQNLCIDKDGTLSCCAI